MKNFLSAAIIALIVAFSANCSAEYASDIYDDDPSYIYVSNNRKGTTVYLDSRTVEVQEYNPPHYQISGKFIFAEASIRYSDEVGYYPNFSSSVIPIRYNWHTKEIFMQNEYGHWNLVDMNKTERKIFHAFLFYTGHMKDFANALFKVAYGMDFYSN